jgi:hypothetical protein
MTGEEIQERALNNDPLALMVILSEPNPSLTAAIRKRVERYVMQCDLEEPISVHRIRLEVDAPSWCKNANSVTGRVMRELGYARHGEEWRYGVKPIGRKAKRHGSRFTVASLRRMKRRDLERLAGLVKQEMETRC